MPLYFPTSITIGSTSINGGTSGKILKDNGTTIGDSIGLTEDSSGNAIIAPTWNSGATIFTAQLINITDTASNASSLIVDWQVGGVSKAKVTKAGGIFGNSLKAFDASGEAFVADNTYGLRMASWAFIGWTSTAYATAGADVTLFRDNANVLGLRNGTNAQSFNVYKTWTSSSVYNRITVAWDGGFGMYRIQPEGGGSPLCVLGGAANNLYLGGGSISWAVLTAGHLYPWATDNMLDIGDGTHRVRNLYVGTSIICAAITASGVIKHASYTVATLPSASTSGVGSSVFVTDASVTKLAGQGTVVAGGGANKVPVYSDGTNWIIN